MLFSMIYDWTPPKVKLPYKNTDYYQPYQVQEASDQQAKSVGKYLSTYDHCGLLALASGQDIDSCSFAGCSVKVLSRIVTLQASLLSLGC